MLHVSRHDTEASSVTVWERMSAAEREAYEREHGHKPAGYRATGRVEWFARWHPDEAPCCKCGAVTDRWVIGFVSAKVVEWGGPTYRGRVLCAETHHPFCWACERTAAIATLRQRTSLGLASEVVYLAELEAEAMERAA